MKDVIRGVVEVLKYIREYPRIIPGLLRLDEQSLHQVKCKYYWAKWRIRDA